GIRLSNESGCLCLAAPCFVCCGFRLQPEDDRPMRVRGRCLLAALCLAAVSCGQQQPPPARTPSGDATFTPLAHEILEDYYKRHPSAATNLGLHEYDSRFEDLSSSSFHAESAALQQFRARLAGIDPSSLSAGNQLDWEQVRLVLDSGVLTI